MAIDRKFPYWVATVYCNGGCKAINKVNNQGMTCEEAMKLYTGDPLECAYGCLGCGSCVSVCEYDAIHINANGVAEVDEDKCVNCGACINKCPRKIIRSRLQDNSMTPLCSNKEKGVVARKQCSASCLGCTMCEKKCPADAIHVVDFCAVVDDEKCLSCGMCVTVCPRNVIVDKKGVVLK